MWCRGYSFFWVVFLILSTGACASGDMPKMRADLDAMKKQLWAVQKQTAEQGLKVAYNSADIALLQERIKAGDTIKRDRESGGGKPESVSRLDDSGSEALVEADAEKVAPAVVAQAGDPGEGSAADFRKLSIEQMYKDAMTRFNNREYDEAISEFQRLIRKTPDHALAANAQFWIGEAYYIQKRFQHAYEEYKKILLRWPDSARAPDTYLKLGLSLMALGDDKEGQRYLDELMERYPDSSATASARRRFGGVTQ